MRQNSGENFLEQQFWLYLYGVMVALMVHLVSSPTALLPASILHQLTAASATTQLFLALGLLFSSVGGLVVAAILKKLDNVVKVRNLQLLSVTLDDVKLFVFCSQEYSSATANMFTAVLCAGLFPDKFRITWFIVLAMTLLFTGIFFYERKSLKLKSSKESLSNCDSSQLLVEQKTESSSSK